MSVATAGRFSCETCGTSYPWKPALAGKKAKCGCGAVMLVPPAPTLVPAQSRQKTKPPPPLATADMPLPPPVARVAPRSATLGYVSARRRVSDSDELPIDKLIDPKRDIYVPTALLAIGFLAILFWAFLAQGINAQISMVVLVASSVSTAIKTTLLVLLAVALANQAGYGFGTFWTAVLKFSSIVIVSDSTLEWFEAWMVHVGAIRVRAGMMYISIWLLVLELFLAGVVIAGLLKYYFDMDHDEVLYLGLGIAIVSMIAGFVLRFLLVRAFEAMLIARTPAPAPAAPPAPTATPAVARPTAALNETPHDKPIRLRIEQKGPFLQSGSDYLQRGVRGRGQKQLYEHLVEAGVTQIYADMEGNLLAPKLYVELPQNPAGRAACFTAYSEYCHDARADLDPAEAKDTGQKYMVIQLKR